ncbi:SDR family NAD(P)-dependent oxidoreductase [Amycolatopsis dendrobii]|uniref:SDR family oxidoreductase n=1 Tax=Amycolatopsis dendrobii TaxID=2760662 RepID=A0A7W3VSQ7_9PSEU|nr:SDR family oxidoreductase [Amycolatopsis dendrobii]MBB1152137.1 SDR family oxidoreductase [Amycolatopsis dendrobii]
MSPISGRSIIVTGGASGIGETAARLFAENDALVTIADISTEAGEALAEELSGKGCEVQFVTTDVADEAQVAAMVDAASVGSFVCIPLAAEYGEHGIRVNAIGPSTARTPMYLKLNPEYEKTVAATPALRRGSEPVKQAQAAMWLLSDAASFVTGVTVPVDGGCLLY